MVSARPFRMLPRPGIEGLKAHLWTKIATKGKRQSGHQRHGHCSALSPWAEPRVTALSLQPRPRPSCQGLCTLAESPAGLREEQSLTFSN